MSYNYTKQINDFATWIEDHIKDLKPLTISKSAYIIGLDVIDGEYKEIVDTGFKIWLSERKYELSFNQMNQAFFIALKNSEKLIII